MGSNSYFLAVIWISVTGPAGEFWASTAHVAMAPSPAAAATSVRRRMFLLSTMLGHNTEAKPGTKCEIFVDLETVPAAAPRRGLVYTHTPAGGGSSHEKSRPYLGGIGVGRCRSVRSGDFDLADQRDGARRERAGGSGSGGESHPDGYRADAHGNQQRRWRVRPGQPGDRAVPTGGQQARIHEISAIGHCAAGGQQSDGGCDDEGRSGDRTGAGGSQRSVGGDAVSGRGVGDRQPEGAGAAPQRAAGDGTDFPLWYGHDGERRRVELGSSKLSDCGHLG